MTPVEIWAFCASLDTVSFFLSKRLNLCSKERRRGLALKPHILIAGVGNIFLGDDAFGCEVVRHLSERLWLENVRIVDFGIRGFDLAYALLEEFDVTILVDATPRGNVPGTLYTIEPDLNELETIDSNGAAIETHGMNPLKVLGMVKS